MHLLSASFSKKDSYSLTWTCPSSIGNSIVFVNIITSLWLTKKSVFVKSINLCTNISFTIAMVKV